MFKGFSPVRHKTIPLHVEFFTELLPLIDDLAEMKVVLFCYRALQQKEGVYRYIRQRDFRQDEAFMRGLAPAGDAEATLAGALNKALARGVLLCAEVQLNGAPEPLYFMNTARGRQAVQLIAAGRWQPHPDQLHIEILPERPNIFTLYEQNIGLLTPLIADALKDAERDFPTLWVEEAIQLAVLHNKPSWKYIRAILDRWQREGRHSDGTIGETAAKDGKRFVSGKYADIIES